MKHIYIDGDNNPGLSTYGIEYLHETDNVKIFYASGNAYYASSKNRKKISELCRAKLDFFKMDSGKNSVDFAVAIEVALDIKGGLGGEYFLVSGDKHFAAVSYVLRQKIKDCPPVFCVKTIAEAISSLAFQAESLEDVYKILCLEFGPAAGTAFFNRILELNSKK